jgi:hypothetical protein
MLLVDFAGPADGVGAAEAVPADAATSSARPAPTTAAAVSFRCTALVVRIRVNKAFLRER